MTFNEFISLLCENIATNGLWSTFLDCVPLLAMTTLFGLGVFFVIRLIRNLVYIRFGI